MRGRLQAEAFINNCSHVICHLTAVSGLCVCVCGGETHPTAPDGMCLFAHVVLLAEHSEWFM